MEPKAIIYLALFFISVSVICGFLLLLFRRNFSWRRQSVLIVVGSISLAIGSTLIYEVIYNIFAGSSSPKHLFEEALSNTYRNKMILGFAIFGGCLAIWARIANQRQLKYTEEQLENSAEINRNDRFAKAVELLNNKDSTIAMRGGLSILRNLVDENSKAEYMRCVEIISHWLTEDGMKMLNNSNLKVSDTMKNNLLDVAVGIFRIGINAEVEAIIDRYKKGNDWDFWPILQLIKLEGADLRGGYFQGADFDQAELINVILKYANLEGVNLQYTKLQGTNLHGANLQNANLRGANLHGVNLSMANLENACLENIKSLWMANLQNTNLTDANLKNANLTMANMREAKNLTKEQILSAKWLKSFESVMSIESNPPKLPDEFMNDSEVQKWLREPADSEVKKS